MATYTGTTILSKENNINDYIESLKSMLGENKQVDNEIKRRIAALLGKVAQIKVGAKTELQRKEKFDRYDDTLNSIRTAMKYGVVPGGAKVEHKLSNLLERKLDINDPLSRAIRLAIDAPYQHLSNTLSTDELNNNNNNIYDPAETVYQSIITGIHTGFNLLTSRCIVGSYEPEDK